MRKELQDQICGDAVLELAADIIACIDLTLQAYKDLQVHYDSTKGHQVLIER